jgi:alpha-glucosidase
VFVRAGAILPMAPLTQSTDETPQGPLTLRVYAGEDCGGELYTDDGESFAYQKGSYLRMSFRCSVSAEGLKVMISKHEGSYRAWWKEIRVEVYGWHGAQGTVAERGKSVARAEQTGAALTFMVADTGSGEELSLQ